MHESITITVTDENTSIDGSISLKGILFAATALLDMVNDEFGISPEDFVWVMQNLREIREKRREAGQGNEPDDEPDDADAAD